MGDKGPAPKGKQMKKGTKAGTKKAQGKPSASN
jgi:hypothetical protein